MIEFIYESEVIGKSFSQFFVKLPVRLEFRKSVGRASPCGVTGLAFPFVPTPEDSDVDIVVHPTFNLVSLGSQAITLKFT